MRLVSWRINGPVMRDCEFASVTSSFMYPGLALRRRDKTINADIW